MSAKNSIQSVATLSGLNYGHGRPGMMLFSTASSSSPAELEQLKENIKLKGEEIRQLKADGVDKASLAPRVQELLALKSQLPPEEGEQPKEKQPKKEKPKKAEKKQPAAKKAVVEETLSESELRANRLAKVAAMREAGVEPFEYTYATTHTATELYALYQDKLEGGEEDESADVSVAGRIMTRRVFGKLAFFTLQDATGTIQLQFDQNRLGDEFQVCMCYMLNQKVKREDIYLVCCGRTLIFYYLLFIHYRISKTGPMVVILSV
jgi:hypothetical protein